MFKTVSHELICSLQCPSWELVFQKSFSQGLPLNTEPPAPFRPLTVNNQNEATSCQLVSKEALGGEVSALYIVSTLFS